MNRQHGLRRRRIAGLALLVALGCDGSTSEPDGGEPARLALSTSFSAAASGSGAARAFDQADALWLRLADDAGTRFETTVAVSAAGSDLQVPVRLEARRSTERLTLELELRRGGDALFAGATAITLRRGAVSAVTVPMDPVVAELGIDPPGRELDAYGETLRLDAVARFATGDTIDGVVLEWSTLDAAIATVNAAGVVTAVDDGMARIVARAGTRTATADVEVRAEVASITIVPAVADVPLGSTMLFSALLADRRGNPIVGRPVEWRSSDPATILIDAAGRVRALRVGLVQVEAMAGTAAAAARVRGAAAPPGAEIGYAEAVEPGRAEIAGAVRPNGLATTVWAEWSRSAGFDGVVERSAERLVLGTVEPVPFLVRPGGFLPGTSYHARIVARNGLRTVWSEALPFDMPVVTPEVRTLPATEITRNAAVLRATVNPGGGATAVRFEIGTSPDLTADGTVRVTTAVPVDGTHAVDVRVTVQGLESGRLHFARAIAENEAGTGVGAVVGFVTASDASGDPPAVATLAPTGVTPTTATLNGLVQPRGRPTLAWFEWGTDPALAAGTSTTGPVPVAAAAASAPLSALLSGLAPGTTYYVRAVAQSDAGTAYGATLSFTTTGGGEPPEGGAPTVATDPASDVTSGSAILNARVTPNGTPTTAWFEWSASADFTAALQTDAQSVGSGTASVAIVALLAGLAPSTTYYVRAVAANAAGTTVGAAVSLTTGPDNGEPGFPPSVATQPATAIAATGAVLNAQINPNGGATTAWFEWGTDPTFAAPSSTPAQAMGAGTAPLPLSAALAGLAPATTYYVRAVAASAAGSTTGSAISFTTLSDEGPGPGPPFVATQAASGIGATQATLNALVNPGGLATTAWFEWGTNPLLAGAVLTPPVSIGAGTSALSVSTLRSALSPGTTYYARAMATNAAGTTAGAIVAFTTLDSPGPTPTAPTVTTLAASMIGTTTARFNGQANPNGSATTAWFEWGTDATLTGFQTTPATAIGAGTSGTAFAFDAAGLATGTTYYVRAAAANAGGERRGAIVSFTTGDDGSPPVLPTVVTGAATDVEPTAATLNGTAGSGGLPGLVWFEWSADPWLDSFVATPAAPLAAGTGTQPISARITSLMPARTFWYRAVASTAAGTVRGAILAFDTPDGPPGPGQPPAVLTLPPLLWDEGIKVQGEVDPRGAATTVWFEWGADPTLGAFTTTPGQALGAGGGTQWVWDYVAGLPPGTTWYVRVAAQNAGGTSRGAILAITLPGW